MTTPEARLGAREGIVRVADAGAAETLYVVALAGPDRIEAMLEGVA